MTSLRVLDLPADRMEGEAVAAFFFEDERPLRGPAALLDWRLDGMLTRLLVQGCASGRAGERILTPNNGKLGAGWVLFAGGGSRQGLGEETYRALVQNLLETCHLAGFSRIALCLAPLPGMGPAGLEKLVAAAAERTAAPLECLMSLVEVSPNSSATRRM
jgi:hypothetical protein